MTLNGVMLCALNRRGNQLIDMRTECTAHEIFLSQLKPCSACEEQKAIYIVVHGTGRLLVGSTQSDRINRIKQNANVDDTIIRRTH